MQNCPSKFHTLFIFGHEVKNSQMGPSSCQNFPLYVVVKLFIGIYHVLASDLFNTI